MINVQLQETLQSRVRQLENEIEAKADELLEARDHEFAEVLFSLSSGLQGARSALKILTLAVNAGKGLGRAEFCAYVHWEKKVSVSAPDYLRREYQEVIDLVEKGTFGGLREANVIRCVDINKDDRFEQVEKAGRRELVSPLRSFLLVPIISSSGEVHGGLCFGHSRANVFGIAEEKLAVSIAAQAALALDNAKLTADLEHESVAAKRYLAIIKSSDDAIISMDLLGVINSWNQGAERMFGYTSSEVLGKSTMLLLSPDLYDEDQSITEYIRAGDRVEHYETQRLRKDGRLVDVSVSVSPIHNEHGSIIGASKVLQDISERKLRDRELEEASAALAVAKRDLEERVVERSQSLMELVEQMEEFSYTVSHDLRAPLRAINAYSDILLVDFHEFFGATPAAHELLQRISANTVRMGKMISDVLTYTKVAKVSDSLESVGLDDLVSATIQNFPSLQYPKACLAVDKLGSVLGHEPSLSQIVSNLLTNAVKFVHSDVTPVVRIYTERREGKVVLWVEDNGIGIDPKYQSKLFTMFERINPERAFEGSGVGLAIVRKAAQRMGGKAGVVSDGSNGSKFWVELMESEVA